jgi:chondroitin-sulfate-ABC endolyase/exolyase
MQYSEASCDGREPRLQANKSVFFFNDQIVVLTSNVRGGDGEFPVVTTLYQCALQNPESTTWTRGRRVSGLEKHDRFNDGKPLTLLDPAGNGYYVPRAESVVAARRRQESLDYTGTQMSVGNFATAWFDHGTRPDNASCEYMILVDSDCEQLEQFARRAAEYYQVLQRDAVAHVVTHRQLGLTGYAVYQPDTKLVQGVVEQADTPCLLMVQSDGGETPGAVLRFSVCNPDLGWEAGNQYKFRPRDRPDRLPAIAPLTPVRIVLNGVWQLPEPSSEVVARARERSTVLRVNCRDALSIEFELERL